MQIILLNYGENFVEFGFSGSFSVNRLYRNKRGFVKPYATHNHLYKILKKNYGDIINSSFKQFSSFSVKYQFIFKDNTKRDLTNYLKAFEDITFRLFIKVDDSRVQETIAIKYVDKRLSMHYVKIEWSEYVPRSSHIKYPTEILKSKSKSKNSKKNQ